MAIIAMTTSSSMSVKADRRTSLINLPAWKRQNLRGINRSARAQDLTAPGAGPKDDPLNIAALRGGKSIDLAHAHGNPGAGLDPFLNLAVAVCKTETAGAVMVTGGQIRPIVR